LLVLKRNLDPDTGKLMTVLSVGEVRRLAGFFGMTSGAGGWRVALVDTADDMNDNAANALLKILEEPPQRAILLLLANAPGRLLPTIRSRCRRLDLRPLDDATTEKALAELLPSMKAAERAALVALSEGSPGLALRLSEGEGLALARDAQRLIDAEGRPDIPALMALGDRVARANDGLADFGEYLARALARRIHRRARDAEAGLDVWVALWERINKDFARAKGLYLEPRQTVLSAALAIEAARRRTKAG
jgi:DNA polymerase-3 subunit delta'